ncbi:MAG: hypothetical protein L3J52_02050 [Proteobacteria bacterium]|nr:hypothetical protein [Pseudomonadota bacterium]
MLKNPQSAIRNPLVLAFVIFFSFSSYSQTLLLNSIDDVGGGITPPPTAFTLYEVDINFDGLKEIPESITLSFPDNSTSVVPRGRFDLRKGYNLRDEDEDPPGIPDFWPIPGWPEDEFSYMWTGSNDDYDVLLTVTNGQLIGLIAGNQKRFGIDRLADGSAYWMSDIRLEGYPPMASLDSTQVTAVETPNINTDHVFTSHLKEITLKEKSLNNRGVNFTTLDMLVVWTEQARIDAGGAPGDPNDTQNIDALITTAVDHTNLALSNSKTNTRVTKFFTAKLNGFSAASSDPRADRDTFKNLNSLNMLRNQVGADVVSGIVRNGVFQGPFPVCGIAYVQTHPTCDSVPVPGCGIGAAFDPSAYNLVAQNCAIFDDTFTHELGHLMGGNHVKNVIPVQVSPAWINDVVNNGYPDAFGRLIHDTFASIMSVDFDTPRRLYFSNPDPSIIVNGTVTGVLNDMDNARIIDLLSPVMSTYRQRPDLIFVNGFE